jgi:hypothetical protein
METKFEIPNDNIDVFNITELMPMYGDIPEEFKNWNNKTKWNKVVSDWFFRGLKNEVWQPKDGIEIQAALRHLRAILSSYEPKHEHKEAAVAYLMSLWFNDVKYETIK